jgi:hypothetical protein
MRYALLIFQDEAGAEVSPEEQSARYAAHIALNKDLSASGALLGRERLRPSSTATTVQVRNGDVVIADGPFAETKEQIGGFYLVECKDLDEAIEMASRIPSAERGTIEVRPVWEM